MKIPDSDKNFWAETPIETLGPILNSIGVSVFVIEVVKDDRYLVSFINKYYESTFNCDASQIAGRYIDDIIPASSVDMVINNYKRCIATGEIDQYDEEIELVSGFFLARTILTPLSKDGRVTRIIGTTNDITDRRAMELELATARDQAEIASKAKSSFMANMSHELRTPLNAVIGYSEMMQTEIFGPLGNPKYSEYLDDVAFAGRHLLEIVNDILDLAQVEAGKTPIEYEQITPQTLIENAVRLVQQTGDSNLPPVTVGRIPENIELSVDVKKMRQCLINLLANAQKFSPPERSILISSELLDDGRLCFVISDSGRGMSASDLPTALAPFGRVDSELNSQTQGAGLGLPITKAFIELHGGNLFMNSQPGIGTTAFMVMPVDRIILPEGAKARPSVEGLKEFFTIDGVDIPSSAAGLAEQSLDKLPIGAILLSASGKVLKYNATESEFSGMKQTRVVGLNFFKEVAPCTFTDTFHGRFSDVSQGKSPSEIFSYVFTLRQKWKVLIEMRPDTQPGNVWLFIRWT